MFSHLSDLAMPPRTQARVKLRVGKNDNVIKLLNGLAFKFELVLMTH